MKKIYLIFIIILITFSCEKDDNLTTLDNQQNKIEVENGILSFSNKDFLGETITELKQMNEEDKELKLNKFYDKGFMPLFPHFQENDIEKIQIFSERKKEKIQKVISLKNSMNSTFQEKSVPTEIDEDGELVEEFDDDLISDDDFASVLNDQREVIVGDTLYKYTYSGMFSVHKTEKAVLDNYISENNIEYLIPDVSVIQRGKTNPTAKITKSIPTESMIMNSIDECGGSYSNSPVNELTLADAFGQDGCSSGGSSGGSTGGSTGGSPGSTVDHTQNLINLIDDLDACNTLNGFLNSGFGLLGVSKKCYANFDSKYRTKTKYWKENYIIWNSIGVKVKHQKKGWTGLWRAKSTDEVALSISQATFKYTINIPNFPSSYAPPRMYFFEDKIFNSQAQLMNYSNAIYKPPFPVIPFNSEVIITEFLQNDWIAYDLSVNKMRELFYQGIWQGAKSIVQTYKNRQPKNVTHIIYTPTVVYLNYVDIENRKVNTKKIVNRLDYNFGIGFKFNVNVDAQGNYSADFGDSFGDVLGNVIIPKLYDYDEVKMDFVGASRRGNTWKGSRIIYTD